MLFQTTTVARRGEERPGERVEVKQESVIQAVAAANRHLSDRERLLDQQEATEQDEDAAARLGTIMQLPSDLVTILTLT